MSEMFIENDLCHIQLQKIHGKPAINHNKAFIELNIFSSIFNIISKISKFRITISLYLNSHFQSLIDKNFSINSFLVRCLKIQFCSKF